MPEMSPDVAVKVLSQLFDMKLLIIDEEFLQFEEE
jgi:hypothetical protein